MAEAIVEDRPHPQQRFYCHICSVEIQLAGSEFTCPICSGGFIEELPAPTEAPSEDVEMAEPNAMDDLDMIRNELATLLMSRTGVRPPESDSAEDDQQGATGRAGRRNRRRHRMQNFDRFDNILLEILHTLSGGNESALGNASMFFMGNPGDYAWGREGIDTIVTQLLNQMDTTGPPPLPKDKIDEIPNVEITLEQVEHKLQCSVCWEDFKLNEPVRKLSCSHVYHENCIVPWLELHGTCPICRKSLTPDSPPDVSNSLRNVATAAFIRNDHTSNSNSGIQINDPTSSTSSQPNMDLSGQDNPFNAIPLTLSRIFSTPGPSSQIQPSSSSNSTVGGLAVQGHHHNNDSMCDSGGGGGGGSSTSTSNSTRTNTDQNDVYKYEDGNVDFEFD